MTYLLDTNVCINYLSGRSAKVMQRMRSVPADTIFVCLIIKAELFYGAMKSRRPEQTLAGHLRFFSQFESLAFDDVAAMIFGEIRTTWHVRDADWPL